MLLPRFTLLQPRSLDEALALLSEADGETRILAGGTDLLVDMKWKRTRPTRLISLTDLAELGELRWEQDGLRIGALVTHGQVDTNQEIRDRYTALAEACRLVGSFQIRTVATVAGNLCSAIPSADSAPPLLVFDARVTVCAVDGAMTIPLDEFFVGPGETVLQPGQLLQEIFVPAMPPRTGSAYLRHSPRKAMDKASVGVAVRVTLDESGVACQDARVALGAVVPTPRRARSAESAVRGKPLDLENIKEAAMLASRESSPRSLPEYRREIVEVLTERALILAGQRASGD